MSVMGNRLSKLEQKRGSVAERLFIVITALGPEAGSVEREPIGLTAFSASGRLISRLPGESIDDLHGRAVREHPEVLVWVTRYEGDEDHYAS